MTIMQRVLPCGKRQLPALSLGPDWRNACANAKR